MELIWIYFFALIGTEYHWLLVEDYQLRIKGDSVTATSTVGMGDFIGSSCKGRWIYEGR